MQRFNYASSTIIMSRWYYNNLEREMCGKQWLVLIKENSVLGNKIVIDDSLKEKELFILCDSQGGHQYYFHKNNLK
jgi:hypothetical protein